jgi:hypothetical protein
MEARGAVRVELEDVLVRQLDVVGVAEVPGEAVEVAEDVTRGARRLAVARRRERVVEKPPAVDDALRLRIEHGEMRRLGVRRRVDDGDRVVEAREDVELSRRLVEDEPARSAAAHRDVVHDARRERVRLELRGVEDPDRGRAERRDVQRRAVRRDRHVERRREAVELRREARLRVARGRVEVLVQVTRGDGAARRIEHGDPRLVEVAADRERRTTRRPRFRGLDVRRDRARSLEADLVPRVGVRDVDLPGHRVRDHVEEDRADAGEELRPRRRRPGRRRARVDDEDVLVGKRELDDGIPAAREPVLPVAGHGIELDDQPELRALHALDVRVGVRRAARKRGAADRARGGDHVVRRAGRVVADAEVVDARRAVARVKHRGVDAVPARAHRERARRVAEEREPRERRSPERGAEIRRIEDPDVGAPEPFRRQVGRRDAAVLPAVRRRDERPIPARAREDDVPGLVADEQRADDARRIRRDVDDAHAVGEVVHHPDLPVRARRDRHGLEADRDRPGMGRVAGGGEREDLDPIVGRVDREETAPVRRQREGTDLTALELDERAGRRGGHRGDEEGGSRSPPGHRPAGSNAPDGA